MEFLSIITDEYENPKHGVLCSETPLNLNENVDVNDDINNLYYNVLITEYIGRGHGKDIAKVGFIYMCIIEYPMKE